MENHNLLIGSIILAIILISFSFFGMFGFSGGMMNSTWGSGMMSGFGFSGMWLFGSLIMLLILVALVLFILWMIKQLGLNESTNKNVNERRQK